MLGVNDFYKESQEKEFEAFNLQSADNCFSKSIYFRDYCINPHPRFGFFFKQRNYSTHKGENRQESDNSGAYFQRYKY